MSHYGRTKDGPCQSGVKGKSLIMIMAFTRVRNQEDRVSGVRGNKTEYEIIRNHALFFQTDVGTLTIETIYFTANYVIIRVSIKI